MIKKHMKWGKNLVSYSISLCNFNVFLVEIKLYDFEINSNYRKLPNKTPNVDLYLKWTENLTPLSQLLNAC